MVETLRGTKLEAVRDGNSKNVVLKVDTRSVEGVNLPDIEILLSPANLDDLIVELEKHQLF